MARKPDESKGATCDLDESPLGKLFVVDSRNTPRPDPIPEMTSSKKRQLLLAFCLRFVVGDGSGTCQI